MATKYEALPLLQIGAYPLTTVQPFVYRDGLTYAKKLEKLVHYINRVIGEVNDANKALYDKVIEHLNEVIEQVNDQLQAQQDAIDAQLAAQDERVDQRLSENEAIIEAQTVYVDAEIAALTQFVNDAVASIIGNSIELQDSVLAGLIEQLDSASREALDNLFLRRQHGVNDFTLISRDGGFVPRPTDSGVTRLTQTASESLMTVSSSAIATWSESRVYLTRIGSRVFIDGIFRRSEPTYTSSLTDIGYVTGPYLPAPIYGDTLNGVDSYQPGSVTLPAVAFNPLTGSATTIPATVRVKASGYVDLLLAEAADFQAVRVSASYRASDYPTFDPLTFPEFEGTNFKAWMRAKGMNEGVNYDVTTRYGSDPRLAVVNIHGGSGEAGAQEVAIGLADATNASLYYLDMRDGFYTPLHMSSNDFDDPRATSLVKAANRCISMHGAIDLTEWGTGNYSYVGGSDEEMREAVIARLRSNGFPCVDAAENIPSLAGTLPSNICNLGVNAGVQIEMSTTLRRALFNGNTYPRSNRDKKSQIFYDYVGALKEATDAWVGV